MRILKRHPRIFMVTVFGAGLGLALFVGALFTHTSDTHESVARSIVATCADAAYRPSCYDEEIPKVMDNGYSMLEAFSITRIVQDLDPSYQYCHVLGHELSAKETAKDPERWKDVIAKAPLGICSNGAIHGAFQERFRVDSMEGRDVREIEGELAGVCQARDGWEPTGMGEATCIHALGHLTMYVTGADIHDSLELCDRLVDGNPDNQDAERQLCYDGAFMQIYQPLEPEDFALIEGKEVETPEEVNTFCSQFEGAKYGSCISEGWPPFAEMLDDPSAIVDLCDRVDFNDWQHTRCLSGVFFLAMAGANLSTEWATSFCPNVRSPYESICFANAAARLVETDNRNIAKALSVCEAAEATNSHKACYEKMLQYATYVFTVESDGFYQICNGIPEPWKAACLHEVPRQ
ncbi:MAG: hypothetical protein WDZ93_01490 [Candidatus Paceibacterota bacterium]